ncbi:MAG TPA: DUF1631 family protein [Gammaproteobacteria bacterium]|nr:DUF1631 family protein [Gammaproteobacteria bacterium]
MREEHNTVQKTPGGAERRAYRRYPVRLPALYHSGDGREWGCEIKDFCIGGMYLATTDPPQAAPPGVGTHITLNCRLPGAAEPLVFQARIVRQEGRHCGIAFMDPDLEALQRLRDYAQQQSGQPSSREHASGARPRQGADALPREALLGDCRDMARGLMETLGREFPERCKERIFDAVEQTRRPQEQNAYFSATAVLTNSAELFRQAFEAAVERRLEAGVSAPAVAEPLPSQNPGHLALVEDEVFEDWLATTDMIEHAESRNQEALRLLERRLSLLFEETVDSDRNPFGAATYAQAFQEALKQLELEHPVMQLCYQVFRQLLTEGIGKLFDEMNAHLVEHGVLPDLEIALPPRATNTAPPPPTPEPAPAEPSTEAGQVQTPANLSDSEAPPEGGAPVGAGNLYDIFERLQSLHATLQARHTGAAGASPQGPQGHGVAEAPVTTGGMAQPSRDNSGPTAPSTEAGHLQYSTSDIMDVLSELQEHPPSTALAEQGCLDTVQSLLAARKGEGGEIPARERNILSVGGNLFQSLLQDMLIASNVRRWIQRLEVPLLKLALEDENLFLDRDHVARQVINQIARLELYEEGSQPGAHNAIHRKINRILDQVARQREVSKETFGQAKIELDRLVGLQEEAYHANLQDLRQACEQEQQYLVAAGGSTENLHHLAVREDPRIMQAFSESSQPEALEEWLRRVHRLKVGEWLLFQGEKEDSRRLRLAWITKKHDRYVFVNLRGLREMTLSDRELAARMYEGTAIILENADDPALDRAQYNMLQNLHRRLLHESTHDQLTGLLNRKEFERIVREMLQAGGFDDERCPVLCYLDIDQFDVINTRCGYEAGDRLLKEFCDLLREVADEESVQSRLTGDDFAMLLPSTSAEEVENHLERWMKEDVSAYRFSHAGQSFPITLSIGLVSFSHAPAEITGILQAAENSCRIAREKGGNQIHTYRPDDSTLEKKQELLYWLSRVDAALADDSLELRCQPIAPITPEGVGAPHHSEILLAMHDGEGQPVSPEGFILAAEHFNRMPAIDRWVIRSALRWMREHARLLAHTGGLAINLSGRSLNDETFRDFILEQIRDSGVDTSLLCFEVTETAGIHSLSAASDFILAVKETGCSFSLDDFGSGMSSYGYLKNLPVDYLKIDGSFVREMDRNPEDYAVVKSITEIGHFMGKKIIAEYVESEEVLALLREIGVDYAQGYAVGKPRLLREIGAGPQ